MANNFTTYGAMRDSFMHLITGMMPNSDERNFRLILTEAINNLMVEGRMTTPAIVRDQIVYFNSNFSLNPSECTITLARDGNGRKVQIISKHTFDTIGIQPAYTSSTLNAVGSVYQPMLIDHGYDDQGNKQYGIPFPNASRDDGSFKLILTIEPRTPINAPSDSDYWVDDLPIYPNCPFAIKTMMQSIVQQNAGNIQQAMDYYNMARNHLVEWANRETQGTYLGINMVHDSILQNSIINPI